MPASSRWQRVPISETYLGLFDGPHATPKPSDEGPVFLGIGNITEDGHLDLNGVRHISEGDFPKWTKRVEPRAGDIVFTYEATLNRYAIIPQGFRGCLGRRLALVRPNPEVVDTRFLHFYFFGANWRATIASNTLSGATVERIPLTRFPDFPISLPPLAEQRRIASILSAYDDLIENNTQRIAILEKMARRIFDEWFVRFRFPGYENVRMVESELGPLPGEWPLVSASTAMHINPKTKVPKEGLKPFLAMNSLADGSMLIESDQVRSGNSGSKFQNGDTLFARITPCLENGKTGFIQFLPDDDATAFGSTEFIVLRSRTLTPEFVYLLARSAPFRDNAIKSMSGASGRQRVRNACFDTFFLPQPDAETLAKFSEYVRPMFRLVHRLANKNTNLRTTRDLLLPKLISGELDLSVLPEPEAVAA